MPFGFGGQTSDDLETLEADEQRLQVRARNKALEVSIAEKEAMLKKLREAGLTSGTFGGSWQKIRAWIKSH